MNPLSCRLAELCGLSVIFPVFTPPELREERNDGGNKDRSANSSILTSFFFRDANFKRRGLVVVQNFLPTLSLSFLISSNQHSVPLLSQWKQHLCQNPWEAIKNFPYCYFHLSNFGLEKRRGRLTQRKRITLAVCSSGCDHLMYNRPSVPPRRTNSCAAHPPRLAADDRCFRGQQAMPHATRVSSTPRSPTITQVPRRVLPHPSPSSHSSGAPRRPRSASQQCPHRLDCHNDPTDLARPSNTTAVTLRQNVDNAIRMESLVSIFLRPQEYDQRVAIAELSSGRKTGHWIWWILPQMLPSLRHRRRHVSQRSQEYQIVSPDMAGAYLKHPTLGPNYVQCASVIAQQLARMNRREDDYALRRAGAGGGGGGGHPPRGATAPCCGAHYLMGSSVDTEKLYMSLSTFILAMYDDLMLRKAVCLHSVKLQLPVSQSPAGWTVIDWAMLELLKSLSRASPHVAFMRDEIPDPFKDTQAIQQTIDMLYRGEPQNGNAGDLVAPASHVGIREAWVDAGGVAP